jgi:hypothetical protein
LQLLLILLGTKRYLVQAITFCEFENGFRLTAQEHLVEICLGHDDLEWLKA